MKQWGGEERVRAGGKGSMVHLLVHGYDAPSGLNCRHGVIIAKVLDCSREHRLTGLPHKGRSGDYRS